jgi:hypothetical protein
MGMNTTYTTHLTHAISTLRKGDDDIWYTTPEIRHQFRDEWIAAGLSHEDLDRLLDDAVYDELERRNEVQREVDATEWDSTYSETLAAILGKIEQTESGVFYLPGRGMVMLCKAIDQKMDLRAAVGAHLDQLNGINTTSRIIYAHKSITLARRIKLYWLLLKRKLS